MEIQPCLIPGLMQNHPATNLISLQSSLSVTIVFSYIAPITFVYLSGTSYKDKTFDKALLSTEPNACS